MDNINFYYLEDATLSNLNRIFNSADIPFIRLSKFLNEAPNKIESELVSEEKIGYYNHKIGDALLANFWDSSEFKDFLCKATGLKPKFRNSNHVSHSPGDYSLLHMDESESSRLLVVYDLTKEWRHEWGGYDLYTSPDKDPLVCNRDFGSLMIVKLNSGDLSCTRYVSLKSQFSTHLDRIIYDLD
tara:strand:+ start:7678 stop:8232 length:555 start_codon:yes stop_codon:yes gene_type:complete